MILTPLEELPRYFAMNTLFHEAFDFLQTVRRQGIPEGRFPIRGESLIAIVSSGEGNKEGTSPLEVHEKYIDIQYVISGVDRMGWKDYTQCSKLSKPYSINDEKALYTDAPSTYFDVLEGQCAIFFPKEAHAPMNGPGIVRKIILKVLA